MAKPYVNPSRRLITFGPYHVGQTRLALLYKAAKREKLSLSALLCKLSDQYLNIQLPLPFGRGCPRKDIKLKFRKSSEKGGLKP